jgi:hypothetical protein
MLHAAVSPEDQLLPAYAGPSIGSMIHNAHDTIYVGLANIMRILRIDSSARRYYKSDEAPDAPCPAELP